VGIIFFQSPVQILGTQSIIRDGREPVAKVSDGSMEGQ